METDLAKLLALKFIQRRDAKAEQSPDGAWHPVREYNPETGKCDGPNIPWKMGDLRSHLEGSKTFGNYLVDQDNNVKLFVLDIDLDAVGTWIEHPYLGADSKEANKYFTDDQALNDQRFMEDTKIHQSSPRDDWHNRKHPARPWYKLQLRTLSDLLARAVSKELGIQTAIAYTGNKGLHVYGFTGTMPASQARDGALLALEAAANIYPTGLDVAPHRGKNFYKFTDNDPHSLFTNMTVEVFPKQDSVSHGGYGNLVRLPLGRNLKHAKDPCFFLDTSVHIAGNEIVPHPDPVALLNGDC